MREHIIIKKSHVDKTFTNHLWFANEVKWLTKLEDFDRTPNILEKDKDNLRLRLSYVGEPLTKKTLPIDWYQQCHDLLDGLRDARCFHNDLKGSNLTILDGKIHVVDFATSLDLYSRDVMLTDELNLFLWIASLKTEENLIHRMRFLQDEARVFNRWM